MGFFFSLALGGGDGDRDEEDSCLRCLRRGGDVRRFGFGEGVLARFLGGDSEESDRSLLFCCLTGDQEGERRRLLGSSSNEGRRRLESLGASLDRRGGEGSLLRGDGRRRVRSRDMERRRTGEERRRLSVERSRADSESEDDEPEGERLR